LTQGWSAATLTPNHNEFLRLAEAVDVAVNEKDPTVSLPEVLVVAETAVSRACTRAWAANFCPSYFMDG
jgi:hypothetical protein